MPFKLTSTFIKEAPAPPSGNKLYRCNQITGFALRVTKSGKKAFVLNYRFEGIERRMTIGNYPEWSLKAAQDQAKDLRRLIDTGTDPLTERKIRREAHRVSDLFQFYKEVKFGDTLTRSDKDRISMWEKDILPALGKRPLKDIDRADIAKLHREITKRSPVRANRILEVFRNALEMAVAEGQISSNVARGFQKNPETPRERYLSDKEGAALLEAISEHNHVVSAQAILLMFLTGARKTETLKSEWQEFDLNLGVWTKPSHHTKQARTHTIPLNTLAIDLLTKAHEERGDCEFVFPNAARVAPLTDVKRSWNSIRDAASLKLWRRNTRISEVLESAGASMHPSKLADWLEEYCERHQLSLQSGIRDLRIHDLRHSFASFLVNQQVDLNTIGRLLGHTQTQTTQRYAHLKDETLRAASEKITNFLEPKNER